MVTDDRWTELGLFLRSRRERLTPQDVGLPSTAQRRTRGLRREEVARLAHVSVSWYTFLEQGRRVRPSTEVLDGLGEALALTAHERRYLHALAGSWASSSEILDAEASAARALVGLHETNAYPVIALGLRGEVIAENPATARWYGETVAGPRGRASDLVHWVCTAPEARERIVNWSEVVRRMAASTRFYLGVHGADIVTRERKDRLCDASPEFRAGWDSRDVVGPGTYRWTFARPERGPFSLGMVVTRPTPDPAAAVLFHVPLER